MYKYKKTEDLEEKILPRSNKIKYLLNLVVDFFKIRSFSELIEKIVYILGTLISIGFIIVLGAMIGWMLLIALLAIALALSILKLFRLWWVR